MSVNIVGIGMNIFMIIVIIILIVLGIVYNNELSTCENTQSAFCYSIQCPCDNQSSPPCFGYAKRPGPQNDQWYCSNAELTLVDNDGNPI